MAVEEPAKATSPTPPLPEEPKEIPAYQSPDEEDDHEPPFEPQYDPIFPSTDDWDELVWLSEHSIHTTFYFRGLSWSRDDVYTELGYNDTVLIKLV